MLKLQSENKEINLTGYFTLTKKNTEKHRKMQ